MSWSYRLISIAFFSVVLTIAIKAQSAGEYVRFQIKNAGITVDGSFNTFKTQINYNVQSPAESSFFGEIDVASIETGIDMRDEHLRKEDYFNAALFPKITFKSSLVSKTNNGLKINGILTIKGKSKNVVLDAVLVDVNGVKYLRTDAILNRLDFNVGESSWVLGDEVKYQIQIRM